MSNRENPTKIAPLYPAWGPQSKSEKWIDRFLDMAELVASWSKDPSTKVGAVIFDIDNRIISTGFNGFARRVPDLDHMLENREVKYPLVIHAEHNAVLFARRDLEGCSVAVTHQPCARCTSVMAQVGIKKIHYRNALDETRWGAEVELARFICAQSGVQLIHTPKTGE